MGQERDKIVTLLEPMMSKSSKNVQIKIGELNSPILNIVQIKYFI